MSESRNNYIGIIKYWAAYSVLMLHVTGFWRTYRGYYMAVEMTYDRVVFFTPVVMFIAISGYLTAASLDRSSSVKNFLIKRAKRIYIPLWVSAVVYLVGYLIVARDLIDISIVPWFITYLLGIAYSPSCLDSFATGSANGVLWTVTVLIELYAISALLWKALKKIPFKFWLCLILPILAIVNVLCEYLVGHSGSVVSQIMERLFFPYAVFFFLGFAFYLHRDRLKYLTPYLVLVPAFTVLFIFLFKLPDYGYYTGILRGLCSALFAVAAGSWSPESIGDHGAAGILDRIASFDFTYEIYLYQWLVFNIFIHMGMFERIEWYEKWLPAGIAVIVALVMHIAVVRLPRIFVRDIIKK